MLFRFGFYNKDNKNSVSSIVEKIKAGDENLKEQFIKDNIIYITRLVSNILGVYIDDKKQRGIQYRVISL